MAQKVTVQLVDDIDDSPIASGEGRTLEFAFDGSSYEIDLTNDNVDAFREAISDYVAAARKVGARRSSGTMSGSVSCAPSSSSSEQRGQARRGASIGTPWPSMVTIRSTKCGSTRKPEFANTAKPPRVRRSSGAVPLYTRRGGSPGLSARGRPQRAAPLRLTTKERLGRRSTTTARAMPLRSVDVRVIGLRRLPSLYGSALGPGPAIVPWNQVGSASAGRASTPPRVAPMMVL